jgi:hypothetical protein
VSINACQDGTLIIIQDIATYNAQTVFGLITLQVDVYQSAHQAQMFLAIKKYVISHALRQDYMQKTIQDNV